MARFAVRMNGELLDQLMAAAGVSPTVLAKDAGVGTSVVSHARAGRPVAPASCLRIAQTLARYPVDPTLVALLADSTALERLHGRFPSLELAGVQVVRADDTDRDAGDQRDHPRVHSVSAHPRDS